MSDVCDVVLEEHAEFRRRFAELDTHHDSDAATLGALWQPLADLLDRHAAAEEEVLYPKLLHRGSDAEDETDDAIDDHNKIRDAVREATRHTAGSPAWWGAVRQAREQNSDHMAEEERGALADFRMHTGRADRDALGARFLDFNARHTPPTRADARDKDPGTYIAEHE